MPLYESMCVSEGCEKFGVPVEHFYSRMTDEDGPCEVCGGAKDRLISSFAVVFTGCITSRYNNRKLEGAHLDGHWATARNTLDGVPRPVFIDTFDKQREFCKSEGLVNPKDVGIMHSRGKTWSNPTGMPGCEI